MGDMRKMRWRPSRRAAWAILLPMVLGLSGTALGMVDGDAPGPRFTQTQVDAGREVYAQHCASCHGLGLEGGAGPALAGSPFDKSWTAGGHSTRDFFDLVSRTMPLTAPGSLDEAQNLDVTAFILSRNGHKAGETALRVADLNVPLAPAAQGNAAVAAVIPPVALPQAPSTTAIATTHSPADADFLRITDNNWLTYNRDYSGDRYSPLTQVTPANVGNLTPKCVLQLGEMGVFETSPLVFQGRMYVTSPHRIFAVNAATCDIFWSYTYTPSEAEHMIGNRGATLYDGKVYRGTTDGHLLAFDAMTGKLLWNMRVADGNLGYLISGAPVAFDGKIFVGEVGADFGIKGHIHAFDANSGRRIWTFNIVPEPGEPGAETWGGGQEHGGGSSWSSMAIDPERRLLLIPTGNPGPDFNAALRPGDNLYTESVVALDLDSGKVRWHVQQVPHDVRDYDTAAAPAIYRLDGRRYMAVASKNGFLYLYDGDTRAKIAQSETLPHSEGYYQPLRFDRPTRVCPGALGQFNGPAYSPKTKMLFVGSADRCDSITLDEPHYISGKVYFGGRVQGDPAESASGWFRGFDAVTGKQVWATHLASPILAGLTPTATGLLFGGQANGDFVAMEQKTGRVLFRFNTGGGMAGGISSYAVDGRQYVAVASGSSSRSWASGGSATIIVFGLP